MVPLKDQIAGILADVAIHGVDRQFVSSSYFERIAQDIIDRVIDDGQYIYDDECHQDVHEPIWDGMGRMEAKIEALEHRINALQAIVEKESFEPYQAFQTWTYSNGGKWIISPEHLEG